MWPILDEIRKHRAFREVWVGYLLGAAYLLFTLRQYWRYGGYDRWFIIQQDIRNYGNILTALLIVTGLPRLMCCEREYETDRIIRTSERGTFLVWRAKVLFSVGYCAAVVVIVGTISLLLNGRKFGFRDALAPVSEAVTFGGAPLPLSNLAYCIVQYVFLFLGAVYFAGFVLLTAQITQHTARTIFLCGGTYLVLFGYAALVLESGQDAPLQYLLIALPLQLLQILNFAGFMAQQKFSSPFISGWEEIWKPVILVILLSSVEFAASWLLWKRRAQK